MLKVFITAINAAEKHHKFQSQPKILTNPVEREFKGEGHFYRICQGQITSTCAMFGITLTTISLL